MFEIVYDDGRRRLDGYPISSPCEPNGSGELKRLTKNVKYNFKIYLLDQCLEKLSLITFELNNYMHY